MNYVTQELRLSSAAYRFESEFHLDPLLWRYLCIFQNEIDY